MIVVSSKQTMKNAVTVKDEGFTYQRHRRRERVTMQSLRWVANKAAEARRHASIDDMLARVSARHRVVRVGEPEQAPNHPQRIIGTVAAFHGLRKDEILSSSRQRSIMAARFDAIAAVWLNCRVDGRSYTLLELGRLFKRDHTTILHALRQRGLRNG